ncbi:hypothetical protein WJX81_002111 [Elliptochloris bilobata]|uniref:Protein kinase domain-containing protein n=1 Tax=Elliptochloris bilobata TaxID=381761 RepID=A0AAW1REH6_9CHLO
MLACTITTLPGVHGAAGGGIVADGPSAPAPGARDVSLLHVGTVDVLFPGSPASPLQPVPLPLGPAYNTSTGFAAAWNVSATLTLDAPMPLRANESAVGAVVRALGTAFYPSGALFELSYVVAAGGNTSGVACGLAQPGFCVNLLFLLQDEGLVAAFNQTLAGWNAASAGVLPPAAASLAGAFKDAAEQLGTHMTRMDVSQADVLRMPLTAPVLTFASDIPLRTDIMVLRLAGAHMLPFEGWKDQATLGALKRALANIAIFVDLFAALPYVDLGITFDFFQSLQLPVDTPGWQPFAPQMQKDLKKAGVPAESVTIMSVNSTTPENLAAAAASSPATSSDAALTASVSAAVDLTKALTDSMTKTLQALNASNSSPASLSGPASPGARVPAYQLPPTQEAQLRPSENAISGGQGALVDSQGKSWQSSSLSSVPSSAGPSAAMIEEDSITICHHEDGSDFLLGQGSFGEVYKALRNNVQECAVKRLRNVNKTELANFQREVQIMQQCSFDRNIVQFYGFCPSPPMLVLEFMEGGDLWSALRGADNAEMRWYARGRSLALDVARGLHFLHEHKIVHADIKSKNVLLSAGRQTAKIADVGLARYIMHTHVATASVPMGTFAYAAPELLLGQRCDTKVDLYSLGVVIWELVTGQMPERGRLRKPIAPAECPAVIAELIEACLTHEPAARPSARQVYDRLMSSPIGAPPGMKTAATAPPGGAAPSCSGSNGTIKPSFGWSSRMASSDEGGQVELYAVIDDNSHIYLVMEYCRGGDLFKQLAARGGCLEEAWVIAPLLRLLVALHARRILHRDIKPENIFLTQGMTFKLGDLGLAIQGDRELPFTRSGTLDYMAPEACILAYECIVGRPPFEVKDERETASRIMYSDHIDFPARHSRVWGDFVRSSTAMKKQ